MHVGWQTCCNFECSDANEMGLWRIAWEPIGKHYTIKTDELII